MSLIKVQNLTFSFPSSHNNIFEDVNFQIDTDWRIGFVGRNGRGKTTFLNLLCGKYEYSGKIISSVKFAYFPYSIADKNKLTKDILCEICPYAQEWEFLREFSYLKVNDDVFYRSFNTLSNGEQTKVLLAALFLHDENFLLIDEPTNHLDINARKIVSTYLQKKKGFILVSHDRYFLDGCVNHILSLNRANIEVQSGNFSSWLTNFEQRQKFELAQNEQLKKDINRLQKSAKRSAIWSDRVEASKIGAVDKGYVGHKSAKMMKRAKSIEARQHKSIEQKAGLLKNLETAEKLKIMPLTYHTDTLISASDVAIYYDKNIICKSVSFNVNRGERIILSGKNGCGKSSLLKLLMGEKIEHSGKIHIGAGVLISYVPQNTSHLGGKLSDFAKKNHIDESLFKAILRKMDFERIQFEKNIVEFSEGQKKKVLLAKSFCERAHLYIWDEPLNFIDIYSRMQIEQLIEDFLPTMLLVEHDEFFQNKIATKIIEIY